MITSKALAIRNRPDQLAITTTFSVNGNVKSKQEIFQSYGKTIVKIKTFYEGTRFLCGKIIEERTQVSLDKNYWDYSNTTGKYRNIFLGEPKKDTVKQIKIKNYELVDLNQWIRENLSSIW